jgi:hypothetical protein
MKEEGGRRKEEGGRRRDEGGRRKDEFPSGSARRYRSTVLRRPTAGT